MAAFAFIGRRNSTLFADATGANQPKFVAGHQEDEQADRDRNADCQRAQHAMAALAAVAKEIDQCGRH